MPSLISHVSFTNDGQHLAICEDDHNIKFYKFDGSLYTEVQTFITDAATYL